VRCRSTTANVNAGSEPNHAEATRRPRATRRLLVGERQHRIYVLAPEKIDYVESHGNYVKFHVGNLDYLARDSVKRLSEALAGCGFVRIRRSLLVNFRAILCAQRLRRGTYAFTLVSGLCLHSGATCRHEILRVLPLAKLPT
jgi:DNA-binding LytR/AlgR family response regulator